jgi:hypothetical protein
MFLLQVVLVCISLFIIVSILISTLRYGISPTPSSRKASCAILSFLPSASKGKLYELGCGWGTLLWDIARHNPDLQLVGYEVSVVPYLFCRLRMRIDPRPNVTIRFADFLKADFADADFLVTYLCPSCMDSLEEKLEAEARKGTVLISNTFALRRRRPDRILKINDFFRTEILSYTL